VKHVVQELDGKSIINGVLRLSLQSSGTGSNSDGITLVARRIPFPKSKEKTYIQERRRIQDLLRQNPGATPWVLSLLEIWRSGDGPINSEIQHRIDRALEALDLPTNDPSVSSVPSREKE
jgi:hypothetical protein